MRRGTRNLLISVMTASLLAVVGACGGGAESPSEADIGVDSVVLSPTVDSPFIAFASVHRAVYEGSEIDEETGETIAVRAEATVRDEPTSVAGVEVTLVDALDFENGELVEQTEDYYAQHRNGDVYYLGERVDDIEDGEVVGHDGQWLAGEDGNPAGLFMPANPDVGTEFEQERAPGIAEDQSTVVATGLAVTVPAGAFTDCIETEDYDPIDDVTEHKFYCRDVGLVREVFAAGGSIELVELERT